MSFTRHLSIEEIQRWREQLDRSERAVLNLLDLGFATAVKDTRTISSNKWRVLSPQHAHMIADFDKPTHIENYFRKRAEQWGQGIAENIFFDLRAWRYLIVIKNRGMSIILDRRKTAVEDSRSKSISFGYIKEETTVCG